jgi:hypothetical protein
MTNFIKENWFKLGILLVLLFAVSAFVFYKQSEKTAAVASSTAVAAGEKYAPEITQFINDLPIGDVSPEKCEELAMEVFNRPQNMTLGIQNDTKYIYSKKLCLADDMFSTSQKTLIDQIVDLGSNEIFAERDLGTVSRLFLFGKEQKSFQDFDSLWRAVKEQI